MAYAVHLDVFDGPFQLLLQLITAQEVDLYEVKLADIVDAFCAQIGNFEKIDLEVATEFLLIASTLIELKCRRLLPGSNDIDLDDEFALFESRDYLLARLLECKTFTGAAASLVALERDAERSVARRAGPDERFDGLAPDLLANITVGQLLALARRGLAERPVPVVSVAHIHQDEVNVLAMLEQLSVMLLDKGTLTFRELTTRAPSTAYVVAAFLAVLELYKRELVDLDQMATFGDLSVRWTGSLDDLDTLGIDDYDGLSIAKP